MVAQRTLTPYVRVRILLPLPKNRSRKVAVLFFLVHDLGAFDAEKLHLRFRRIRFTPKVTPIKSFTP